MTSSRAVRGVLVGLLAIVLLGVLAFLYSRTEAIDFKRDAQTLDLLRELKELDMRWDADATQLATAAVPRHRPARSRPGAGAHPARARARPFAPRGGRRASRDQGRHGREDRRLGGAQGAARPVGRGARRRARPPPRRWPNAATFMRLSDPRRAERFTALAAEAQALLAAVRTAESAGGPVEARLATLREAAVDAAPELGEPAARAEQALRALLAARIAEREAAQKFGFLTVGGRVDLLAQTISRVGAGRPRGQGALARLPVRLRGRAADRRGLPRRARLRRAGRPQGGQREPREARRPCARRSSRRRW